MEPEEGTYDLRCLVKVIDFHLKGVGFKLTYTTQRVERGFM